MTSARYFYVFFALLLLLAGTVVALNRLVDPFWYYRDVSIEGLNAIKPKFLRYERHVKPALVQREQPASLIFGSSFSEIGFDPMHPALRAVGKSYNFALAGAQWDMVNCNVQFAIKHDHALRQIVLGIHPTAMPQKDCSADLAKLESPDVQAFLFSYDALEASLNTLLEQRKRKPSHTAEGLYFYARGATGTANRFQQDFSHFTPCPIPARQPPHPHTPINLTGLRELLELTKQHNIAVKLVVYPSHSLSIERQYQCALRQSRWEALQDIATLVQGRSDSVQVWDFEGYHEVGTEAISDEPAVYWQDLAHFNSELGNIMLDEMFGVVPPRLGLRLTPESVEVRAQTELRQRNDYLARHPEFLSQLQALWPKH